MPQRYFLQLSYKGTNYHGWQIQPNAVSVQEVMEDALSKILREKIEVVGAGRTDTGVHASFFILHFDSENGIPKNLDIVYKLNSFLPSDIAVQKVWPVDAEAHARFSAISRTYHYFISTEKDPFATETSHKYLKPLDVEKMNQAAQKLFNYTDFTSFSRLHTDVKTNNCKIMQAEWTQRGERLQFTIKADRFLRNMVRAIVGTLLEVGQGKLSIDQFCEIIEKQDRGSAGASAPAQGLFLVDIGYPEKLIRKSLDYFKS
ncbi:tRNA pseudouridine(38-40) synthase TruA [Draconibacterium sediminis]|uniref:tRNA pseudouridine synthase A n=1 Tax=Draconibacterium sediminis TaxID=1544798 RepID=A0A0D8J6X5_9BACT|nr:tRNA pseudouridine(38-40) synthase TruA [Draconibacterium sediminis]KJF42700.1 pseudouridine synthase [Draconibacterium sediminis]